MTIFVLLSVILLCFVAVLVLGAIFTAFASRLIAAAHPPVGRFVSAAGGRVHVVELGKPRADTSAIVLIHGASGNLEDMRPLGEALAVRWRVVLIDRPGHGWSDRVDGPVAATPERQAQVIAATLDELRISKAIIVGHSLGGSVATAFALAQSQRAAALVLLAAVTHPWPGGIAWYYTLSKMRLIGLLFARTLALPLGLLLLRSGVRAVFAPNPPPRDYISRSGVAMFLRPAEFIANAADVAALYPWVERQSPRYGELEMPVAILSGDADSVVSVDVHARAMARDVKEARLIVLPRTGHMPHYSALEVTTDLIEQTADRAGFAASLSQGGDKRGSHAETPGFAPPLFKKFGLSSVEET